MGERGNHFIPASRTFPSRGSPYPIRSPKAFPLRGRCLSSQTGADEVFSTLSKRFLFPSHQSLQRLWFFGLEGDRPPLRRQASVSALTPPCGARKNVRACAFPPAFRPLRKWSAAFFCPRQRWCSIPPGTSFTTAPVRSPGSQAKTKKHPIGCFSCFG